MHPLKLSLSALLLLLAVLGLSQEAEAEADSVEILLNDTALYFQYNETSHIESVESGTDIELFIRLKGGFRDSESDLYVESILTTIYFRSYENPKDSVIGYPEYQPLCSNCSDPGYDEYRIIFGGTDERFTNYLGKIEVGVTMKNGSGGVVWNLLYSFEIVGKPGSSSLSDDTNNNLLIAAGIAGVIILGGGAVIISRKKTQDPYVLPEYDDNNYPTSYENDRRSDEVVKQIKTLEESEMDKGTNGDDKFTKLQDLKTMYKEGLIDEKEFNKLKKEILE